MIRVIKSTKVPKKLTGDGQVASTANAALYKNNPQSYVTKSFPIVPEIYGHPTVKKQLKIDQDTKCCYCEDKRLNDCGQVEHFRPKSGYIGSRKQPLNRPGYYWLGYDWRNLYFICGECNWRKGAYFPVADETMRMRSHADAANIALEDCLLLDPAGTRDPRDHLVFDRELIRATSSYGQATIDACGLDRGDLNELRKKLISNIEFRASVIRDQSSPPALVAQSKAFLTECQQRAAEFSAAAVDFLKQNYPELVI